MSDLLPEEKLLLQTADWFEEDHSRWCGFAFDDPEQRCIGLALVAEGAVWQPALARLIRYLGGDTEGDVYRWNDHPSRSVYDVIDALRRAAKPEFRAFRSRP